MSALNGAHSMLSDPAFRDAILNGLPGVFLAGGVGAVVRFCALALCAHATGPFPSGILVVNALAAFLGALLLSGGASPALMLLAGGGFVGSLGTLSSLVSEVIALHERRRWRTLAAFVLLTLVTGVAATLGGLALGEGLYLGGPAT